MIISIVIAIIISLASASLGYFLRKHSAEKKIQDAEHKAGEILGEAKKEVERLALKEDNIDRRMVLLEKKEKELESRSEALRANEEALKAKDRQLAALVNEEKERLQKIANLTIDEAKKVLLARLSEELNNEKAVLIKNIDEEIKNSADKKAKEVITLAIQS